MENMSDALRISFAVLVFVIALTITFTLIAHAKKTSDIVLTASDKTTLYTYNGDDPSNPQGYSSGRNRTVGVSQVISTLYRYYKESLCVTIDLGGPDVTVFNQDYEDTAKMTEDIEKELGEYIQDNLETLPDTTEFSEEFVEVPISGIYDTAEDGTEIILSSGGKKVYITYTKK